MRGLKVFYKGFVISVMDFYLNFARVYTILKC